MNTSAFRFVVAGLLLGAAIVAPVAGEQQRATSSIQARPLSDDTSVGLFVLGRTREHQPAYLCTLVMTDNVDANGVARYPVGTWPILDKDTAHFDLLSVWAPPRALAPDGVCTHSWALPT